ILKRKVSVEKAKITRARNNALRGSVFGRLLLTLERCSALQPLEPNKRKLPFYLNELAYGCKLASEAGISKGWERQAGSFVLVFGLPEGDIVFNTFEHCTAVERFPRLPAALDNAAILELAVEQLLVV